MLSVRELLGPEHLSPDNAVWEDWSFISVLGQRWKDILYNALWQTLPDIAYTYAQLVAAEFGEGATEAQRSCWWRPCKSANLTTMLKLDFWEQSYLFHQPHVSLEVIPTLSEHAVLPNTLSPRLHSRDRNSQNVLLYSMIFKNLYNEPRIKVFIVQMFHSHGGKSWFSHFLACQKYSSSFLFLIDKYISVLTCT